MRGWTVRDSNELYNVANWGAGFFTVNDKGHVEVRPRGDQGPGIDSEALSKIFTPFFRAGNGSGTGLGLVISRQIAREHGGEIRVDSKPGEGAIFTVVLPGAP